MVGVSPRRVTGQSWGRFMSNGFIQLHRKTLESAVFQDPGVFQMWVYCLCKATYKDRQFLHGNEVINLKPGEFVTGRKVLAESLGCSERNIRTRLSTLQQLGNICIKSTNKYSKISVVNWDYYQQNSQKVTNNRPTTDQQLTTNNKVNKVNNNTGEESPDNQKDMSFKNQQKYKEDGHWEEPAIDADTGEEILDEIEVEKAELRELNEKIRHNLKLVEPARGIPFGKGKDMNYHVKIYREMLDAGWSHGGIFDEFIALINSDHWKKQRKLGYYPGMNTVQFTCRNKKPI